jgi:predicted nucleic acid-binding protein
LIYFDTSALVKRYVPENNSQVADMYFVENAPVMVSRLVLLELRCTIARKRRNGEISGAAERNIMDKARQDMQDGVLVMYPMADAYIVEAMRLLEEYPQFPLRTLDASHLAAAQALEVSGLATADAVMRDVAQAMGFPVAYFGN